MPVRTFDYCALQFINLWIDKEEGYCHAVASEDIEQRRQGLRNASGHFRIARNLPEQYEQAGRFQTVLEYLGDIHNATDDNVVDIVNDFQKQISQAYGGRNVLSAATKFLWLKLKSPVRIYDSQARTALGTNINDYSAFNAAFTIKYTEVKDQIACACSSLVHVISYTVNPTIATQKLEELVHQQWFQERVFDIYLWNAGNA